MISLNFCHIHYILMQNWNLKKLFLAISTFRNKKLGSHSNAIVLIPIINICSLIFSNKSPSQSGVTQNQLRISFRNFCVSFSLRSTVIAIILLQFYVNSTSSYIILRDPWRDLNYLNYFNLILLCCSTKQ